MSIPARALIVNPKFEGEDKLRVQHRLANEIEKVQQNVAADHPPYHYPTTGEEWWATVDEYWSELLTLTSYELNLGALADPDGRPAGTTLPIVHPEPLAVVLENMRRDRNLRLYDLFNDLWAAAPDSGEIHARPAWHVLCDLCSEGYDCLYDDEPQEESK